MNRESTSRRLTGRGIHDGVEASCRLQHTLSSSLFDQDQDCVKTKSERLAESELEKSKYGRRRTESAPDALLDCLHCGKDLYDLREERAAHGSKKRHSRRYTVASERVWPPTESSSPLRNSCIQHQGKNECQVSESKYEKGLRGKSGKCAGARWQGPKGICCHRCGDQFTCPEYAENDLKQVSCKHSREKKGFQRLDDIRVWQNSTDSLPQSFTPDDSPEDDYTAHNISSYRDNPRSGPQSLKNKGDDIDDAACDDDDDSETELININENRRRKSITCLSRNHHKHGDRQAVRLKPPRHKYSKKRSCSADLHHHHTESQKEDAKKGHNSQRRSTSYRSERSYQQQTSVDEEKYGDRPEAATTTAHTDSVHQDNLIANLSDMLRRHRLCDVTLRSNGQEVPAHKLALAAFSDTFARTYCQCDKRDMVIDIPDTSVGGIQEVLRYLYSGDIRLNPDNVGNVLAVATFLHIDHIVHLCKQIILNPDIETVIFFNSLAEKYHLSEDLAYFYDFVCKHFFRVSRTRGWKTLTYAQVFDLLSENNLNVERELDVFHAAVSWIDADRASRLTFAADLIGCVRFVYITPEEIAKHVESKQFLFQGDEGKELLLCIYSRPTRPRFHNSNSELMKIRRPCRSILQTCGCHHGQRGHHLPRRQYVALEAMASQQNQSNSAFSPSHRLVLPSSAHPVHRPLTHHAPPIADVILAVGGVNPFRPDVEDQARVATQFHPRHNHWTTVTRLPDGRHHHGAVLLGGCLYIIGGSILDDLNPEQLCNPSASCYHYDLSNKQWSAVAPLNVPRMYHATAVLNEVIFVMAGQTHQSKHLTSMECYRPEVGEWEMGVGMAEGRIGVAVAAHRGQLYAVGGFLETEQEHVVRATVEVFDPRNCCWTRLNALPSPRCHAGLAECRDKLYLVGGSTFPADSASVCSLPSVLRYDDSEDRWDRIQTLRIPRHDMGVAVLGSRIFVVGGVTSVENKVLNDVACYDVETNYWLDDVEPIGSPALGLVCVTLLIDQ